MKLNEAKQQFVQLWGAFGGAWGINKTMAQVHALLLVSTDSLSTEDIMNELSISRGNANMNVRELMAWNLVYKDFKQGERKEFFKAEKDMWEVATRIAKERKRREIQPLIASLNMLTDIDEDKRVKEVKEYVDMLNSIHSIVSKMDSAVDTLIKTEENKFFNAFMKLFKSI
ncbi:MAG: transcriptional regulator [Chitinophagaceae bacterium]